MSKRKALLAALTQMEEGIGFEVGNRAYYFDEHDDLYCRQSGVALVAGISLNDFAILCDLEARGLA